MLWALALAFLLALDGEAAARRVVPEVDLLRLEGHVRGPRPQDKGTTDLTLDWHRKQYRFQLTDLRVMNGGRLPGDILSAVSPYRPNMVLYGAEAMMNRLDEAKPDDHVQILGYFRIVSRTLMVNEVNIIGPPTPAPTPAH